MNKIHQSRESSFERKWIPIGSIRIPRSIAGESGRGRVDDWNIARFRTPSSKRGEEGIVAPTSAQSAPDSTIRWTRVAVIIDTLCGTMPPDENTNIFSVIKAVISDPLFKQIASRIINKVILKSLFSFKALFFFSKGLDLFQIKDIVEERERNETRSPFNAAQPSARVRRSKFY